MTAVRLSASAGCVPENVVALVSSRLPDTRVRDRLSEIGDSAESPEAIANRFGASGYVVEAVPLALFVAAVSG